MKLPWKSNASPWIEVTPGERGTPEDEFVSFTYWEPSDALEREMQEDAREAGSAGLPDVTAPRPLREPDGLTKLRNLVEDACHGRKAAAVELFRPTYEEIAKLVAQVQAGTPKSSTSSSNLSRDKAAYTALWARLEVEQSRLERLEYALEARLHRLESHFDSIAAEFVHDLKRHHAFADILDAHWPGPVPFVIPEDALEFGQAEARALLAEADEFASKNQEAE